MGRMKEIDIAGKSGENLEDAINRVSQSRKRNHNAPKQPNNPFLIDLTPYNRWVITHTDIEGKVTLIADKLPSRNLAEKALKWFMEGRYRRYKMSWIRDPNQKQPPLFISSGWFNKPLKTSGRFRYPFFEKDQPQPNLMRRIGMGMAMFFKGFLGRGARD